MVGKTVIDFMAAKDAPFMPVVAFIGNPNVATAVNTAVAFDAHNRRNPDDQVHQLYEKMLSLHDDLYAALASRNIYEKALEIREMLAAHRR